MLTSHSIFSRHVKYTVTESMKKTTPLILASWVVPSGSKNYSFTICNYAKNTIPQTT